MTADFKNKIIKIASNRRARFEYAIKDTIEAGIELKGIEVKSLRVSKVTIDEAYAEIVDGELWLKGFHVTPYDKAGYEKVEPGRKRKLLVHKLEIQKLSKKVQQKGFTLIPLEIYFKGPWAKVSIGVGIGKKLHDKRESLKKKSDTRDAQRGFKNKMKIS